MMEQQEDNSAMVVSLSRSRGSMFPGPRKRLKFEPEPGVMVSYANTEFIKDSFAFTWTLNNFSDVADLEEVFSPVFEGGPKSNHQWRLKVNPKETIEGRDYLGAHLQLVEFGDGSGSQNPRQSIRAHYQLDLLGADGHPAKRTESTRDFTAGAAWGYEKLMRVSQLEPNGLLNGDALTIFCKIWIDMGFKHQFGDYHVPEADEQREFLKKVKLAEDISKLFQEPVGSDVTLRVNGMDISAHKGVLAARSSVFSAMFEDDPEERGIPFPPVAITEHDTEVVRGMVEFIYTGKVDTNLLCQKAPALLCIAEHFGVAALKEECQTHIMEHLNIENASSLLVFGNHLQAPLLKAEVISFINRNKEEVMKTDGFQTTARTQPALFVDLWLALMNNE